MVNQEKKTTNKTQTKKHTLTSAFCKRQHAEITVATAPDQNALLVSQFEHGFPDSHIIDTIVSK